MRHTTQLRRLVARPDLAFLMEAHDGVSARIAAEAGFEGVWASGLTMSASFGVRDNNELSWSQVVDHVGFMADAAAAPILVDGDTGYGNFNNMRRLVRKLEQVGVAGVTIEDKLFPKTNSFLRSEQQPLADVEEFCGKIKAGKDSQADPDFDAELEQAERRYLPAARDAALSAVVLAAGAGADFAGLTAAVPKAMLKVQGRPILARLLDDLGHFGCRAVTVVRGYRAEAVEVSGARFVDNAEFATTGEAHSLALAETALGADTLVAFGDIVLKRYIVQALLEEAGEGITLSVDSALAGHEVPDRARGSRPDAGRFSFEPVRLAAIGDAVGCEASHGGWIGLLHLGAEGAAWLREAIAESRADGTLARARLSDLLTRVLAHGRPVTVVYTRGGWVNVNNLADLIDASAI